jgi:hypothetical protein
MAAEKLSISFDPETVARARRAAEHEGLALSTWIDRAARREADLVEARAALAEQFAQFGEPTDEAREWVRARLTETGAGLPEAPEQAAQRQAALAALDAMSSGDEEGEPGK